VLQTSAWYLNLNISVLKSVLSLYTQWNTRESNTLFNTYYLEKLAFETSHDIEADSSSLSSALVIR